MPVAVTALDDRTVSAAVVDAVAEAEDVSPTEIRPPLYRAIDTDALNDLFRSDASAPTGEPRVTFSYAGYEVTVRGEDEVVVRDEIDGGVEASE